MPADAPRKPIGQQRGTASPTAPQVTIFDLALPVRPGGRVFVLSAVLPCFYNLREPPSDEPWPGNVPAKHARSC